MNDPIIVLHVALILAVCWLYVLLSYGLAGKIEPPPGDPWLEVSVMQILERSNAGYLRPSSRIAFRIDDTWIAGVVDLEPREITYLCMRAESFYIRPACGSRLCVHAQGYCTFHVHSIDIRTPTNGF